jgi:hypothetical protein
MAGGYPRGPSGYSGHMDAPLFAPLTLTINREQRHLTFDTRISLGTWLCAFGMTGNAPAWNEDSDEYRGPPSVFDHEDEL